MALISAVSGWRVSSVARRKGMPFVPVAHGQRILRGFGASMREFNRPKAYGAEGLRAGLGFLLGHGFHLPCYLWRHEDKFAPGEMYYTALS